MNDRTRPDDRSIGVLICDDDRSLRRLLRIIVELRDGSNGEARLHVVGEAIDGNEAVAEAKRLQPDVILLDLSMPRRTGLDALPEIKNVAPEAKIIVLSAFDASVMAHEVLTRGADRYMEKGSDPEMIANEIAEIGGSTPSFRPDDVTATATVSLQGTDGSRR